MSEYFECDNFRCIAYMDGHCMWKKSDKDKIDLSDNSVCPRIIEQLLKEQNLVNLNKILCDEQEKGGVMTNREKYMKEICDVALSGDRIAVNSETSIPCKCSAASCKKCIANTANGLCDYNLIDKWANSEYVEPCPFEKDELVEVSVNKKDWRIRYFSHMEENDPKYAVFMSGNKSTETTDICHYNYCRKYGTLCGLVKEENRDD